MDIDNTNEHATEHSLTPNKCIEMGNIKSRPLLLIACSKDKRSLETLDEKEWDLVVCFNFWCIPCNSSVVLWHFSHKLRFSNFDSRVSILALRVCIYGGVGWLTAYYVAANTRTWLAIISRLQWNRKRRLKLTRLTASSPRPFSEHRPLWSQKVSFPDGKTGGGGGGGGVGNPRFFCRGTRLCAEIFWFISYSTG